MDSTIPHLYAVYQQLVTYTIVTLTFICAHTPATGLDQTLLYLSYNTLQPSHLRRVLFLDAIFELSEED